jgi:hypothetical protein
LVAIATADVVGIDSAGAAGKHKGGKTVTAADGSFSLTVEVERDYLSGFPMLIAVEIRNQSDNTSYNFFRRLDLFNSGSVSFSLRGGGHEWTWPAASPSMEAEPRGVPFSEKMIWRGLHDLSELHPDIPTGHYELSADFSLIGGAGHAGPVRFEVHAPSREDLTIARKLRATNDLGEPSWSAFIKHNWSTPHTNGLSSAGHARLAYYLYLHRVAYGPRSVAQLDPEEPWKFGHGVLEPEAALLRLEILRAVKRPEAKGVEAAILERWPGLAWRIEQIHNGLGLLTLQRTFYGVESPDAPKGKPRPYSDR